MEAAIGKAAGLIEALPYIQAFNGKRVVIKLGGSFMEERRFETAVLTDIVFMAAVGMQPIIVHGGGKEISAAMQSAGLEPHFVQGLRYTDHRTLSIAEHVLCDGINNRLVRTINDLGGEAMGLHSLSSCVLFAKQTYLAGEDGRRLDIGHVGEIVDVNAEIVELLCKAGTIPIIAPVARDRAGGKLNVNADTVAGKVAAAVRAEKLVLLSDTHGVRANLDDPESFYPSLTEVEVRQFMDKGIIAKGMVPKVEACLQAVDAGVTKAHIIDGRIEHSLLLEIFTHKGVGTQILKKKEDG